MSFLDGGEGGHWSYARRSRQYFCADATSASEEPVMGREEEAWRLRR
jgi:hypothetical protein